MAFDPATLVGARLTRIDASAVDCLVFGFHHDGRARWLQVQVGRVVAITEVVERGRGQNATSFTTQLRRWLIGENVTWCTNERVFRLGFGAFEVVVEAPMQIMVLREEKIVGVLHGAKLKARGLRPGGAYAVSQHGLAETAEDDGETQQAPAPPATRSGPSNDPLLAALQRAQKKLATRVAAIENDLQRAVLATETRDELLERANAHYQELSESRSPTPPQTREESEKIYHAAKRMARGTSTMNTRLLAAENAQKDIERWLSVLASANNDEPTRKRIAAALDDLRILSTRIATPKGSPTTTASKAPSRLPYRVFTWQGNTAWVGKSGADNEATLRASSPHDVWLHVDGVPGSHVLLRMARAAQMSESGLLGAALLAAHFSKSRDEPRVLVMHCARHQVRFAKGRKQLGQVIPVNPKRIWVDTDDMLLKELLSSTSD